MSIKRNFPEPLLKIIRVVWPIMLLGLSLLVLAGCGPSAAELEAVDYTPLPTDDWEISTPEEQGLDPADWVRDSLQVYTEDA